MGTLQNFTSPKPAVSMHTRRRVFFSAARYLAVKALTVLATIFLGVFITMIIVDVPTSFGGELRTSPFQMRLENQIQWVLEVLTLNELIPMDAHGTPIQAELKAVEQRLRSEAGLDLSYLPRYLLWTYKALTFNWGELDVQYISQFENNAPPNIVLQRLPNTLLLVGTAYLLVFLIGMPFSLYLARHYGGWLDRALAVISPISSVPSWVFAMLLITIFAVQLHWLPVAGMFDFHQPTDPISYVLVLGRHMVLPVAALVLSLFFQLVYTWRTFFIIYSEEDYVDLARAKGLETRLLEKQYILRPALPYIITSFITSLIGFWQLTIVLEKVFSWPGLGLLYIEVLPNFWEEAMQVGDLMVVVQIVVTFSYLLGLLVFLMDFAYVVVDPRIHLMPGSHVAQSMARVRRKHKGGGGLFGRSRATTRGATVPAAGGRGKCKVPWDLRIRNMRESMQETRERVRLFIEQLRMYPSAILGLVILTLLFAGSVYAVTALPYEEIGSNYDQKRSTGRNLRPRTAAPAWLNLFSLSPRLSTLLLDEKSREANVTTERLENGWVQKTVTFRFDYRYKEIPSDVFLYLDSDYEEKAPFVSAEWTTPDGRMIRLKDKGVGGDSSYDISAGISVASLLVKNPEWKNWFTTRGQYPTPAFALLFAKPGANEPLPMQGTYQLKLTTLLFEEESDLQSQLVVLGQVYGLAGTDYWRRDLIVPLLWGMPFTLMVGFLGTFLTALISILLPAIGVWFGGALDTFIQRLSEMNMVLPGLAIAVLASALMGVHMWVILGIVVVLNALGAPIKSFRAAFLQAKEAPYIEMARSYGASDFRIITRYLVPRILPVLIPYLVMQIPTFIFLEATLGFFNIRSVYPSWGRIIYEGLSRSALYGSPFWVLEPLFLLLLTGLAFALLGLALERILNPRVIADIPVSSSRAKPKHPRTREARSRREKRMMVALMVILVVLITFIPSVQGKTLASLFMNYLDQSVKRDTRMKGPVPTMTNTAVPVSSPTSTESPMIVTEPLPTQMPSIAQASTSTATAIPATPTSTPAATRPVTYQLQRGEYPYCIARRYDVDPGELMVLNGMLDRQTFYAGLVLRIPQTGRPFPGERMQRLHPATYTVSSADQTLYTIACEFGDIDPSAIARANHLSLNAALSAGQTLIVP